MSRAVRGVAFNLGLADWGMQILNSTCEVRWAGAERLNWTVCWVAGGVRLRGEEGTWKPFQHVNAPPKTESCDRTGRWYPEFPSLPVTKPFSGWLIDLARAGTPTRKMYAQCSRSLRFGQFPRAVRRFGWRICWLTKSDRSRRERLRFYGRAAAFEQERVINGK